MARRVALRFDAGPELGFGHAHRCLALAAALREQGCETLVLSRTPDAVRSLDPDCELVRIDGDEIEGVTSAARGVDLAVLDYLDPPEARIAGIRRGLAGARIALIGNREPEALADLTIRQSVETGAASHAALTGAQYLLLKPQFQGLPRRKIAPAARRALVCLGGGRPRGLARLLGLLDACAPDTLEQVDVIGPGAGHALPAQPTRSFEAFDHVELMAPAMMAADIGLIASGGLTHEAAACGLPVLYCPVVEHQIGVAQAGERAGFGWLTGDPVTLTRDRLEAGLLRLLDEAATRQAMALAGQNAVDGHGASRAATALIALASPA